MTWTRASKLFELALALPCSTASLGCAAAAALGNAQAVRYVTPPATGEPIGPVPAGVEAGDTKGRTTRRPDGVTLELAAAIPASLLRSAANGVIALHPPLGSGAVQELVSELLDAWTSESIERLSALLTADAGPLEARSRGRAVLVESWRQRLHSHEYHRLLETELVRPGRVERYTSDELSAVRAGPRPSEMTQDELFVRLPLEVTHLAGERVFGDAILLVLRRDDMKFKILAYGEQ